MTRTRRWPIHAGVSLLLAAGAVIAGAAPAGASGSWQQVGRLSLGLSADIACPTATACWAITGGELLNSTDGGASWTPQSARVPDVVDVLDALDCPAADTCYLAGQDRDRFPVMVRLAPDNDSSVIVEAAQGMTSVSCSTLTRCIATDSKSVYETTDGGLTWPQVGTLPMSYAWAVSCARNTLRCWAAGNTYPTAQVARSLDGGHTWKLQQQVGGAGTFYSIDCPTATTCLTTGGPNSFTGTVYYTHDAGLTWARGTLPQNTDPLYFIACGSADNCVATGGPGGAGFGAPFAIGSADGGATWTNQALGGSVPVGASAGSPPVSCGSATACVAVTRAGLGYATTDAGANWTSVAIPASLTAIDRMDCPSAALCVALGRDSLLRRIGLTSTDRGATWTTRIIGFASGYIGSLECVTTTTCYAVTVTTTSDGTRTKTVGLLYYTNNGGVSWATKTGPEIRSLRALSCPTVSTCLGIGAQNDRARTPLVLRTTDTFTTWQTLPAPSGAAGLAAVACASTTACVITASASTGGAADLAEFTPDLGTTFTPSTLPASGTGYRGLACVGLTCYAVSMAADFAGLVVKSTDGGATWRQQAVPTDATRLGQISCSTARICAITANSGSQNGDGAEMLTTATGGRPWTVQPLPNPQTSFVNAVACAGTTCLESDYGPNSTPRIVSGMP